MASRIFSSQQSRRKSSRPLPGCPALPNQNGMSWAEACAQSPFGTATRRQENGRAMLRSRQGNGVIETASGTVRLAYPNELEGFHDWQPVDVIAATGGWHG